MLAIGANADRDGGAIKKNRHYLQQARAAVKSPDEHVEKCHGFTYVTRGYLTRSDSVLLGCSFWPVGQYRYASAKRITAPPTYVQELGVSPQTKYVHSGLRIGSSKTIAPASVASTKRRPYAIR